MIRQQNPAHCFDKEDAQAIVTMIETGELSIIRGGIQAEFESEVADYFGHSFGLSTCNGTAAIYAALWSCGVGPSDEVIVPAYCFHGAVVPILLLGAQPVFCDINYETLTVDFNDALRKKINERTKAILVLQPWGNLANVDQLVEIKKETGVITISDSSHAFGALWAGNPLGQYYDIIVASFGKGKLVTGGELGCLTTSDREIFERAMLFGHVNRVPKDLSIPELSRFNNAVGLKIRPHALALKLGLISLSKFKEASKIFLRNGNRFEQQLRTITGFTFPVSYELAQRSFWKPPVMIELGDVRMTASQVVAYLRERGVGAESHHYSCLLPENNIFTDYYNIGNKMEYDLRFLNNDAIFHIPETLFFSESDTEALLDILHCMPFGRANE